MLDGKNMNPPAAPGARRVSAVRWFGFRPTLPVVAFGVLSSACNQGLANAEQNPTLSSEPTVKAALLPSPPANKPLEDEGELSDELGDADLRRGYGTVDMRFNACVSRPNDYTFEGEGCQAGVLVFGPYVQVPADSEIEVSFELKPSKTVEVFADIVSQMGIQTLAGLSRTRVEAGETQKLGYRVHVFNADTNVESRIGIALEPGAPFQITNFLMVVR
jgi:hypothetical protein